MLSVPPGKLDTIGLDQDYQQCGGGVCQGYRLAVCPQENTVPLWGAMAQKRLDFERFRIRPPGAGGGGRDERTPARRRSVRGGVNVSGPAPGRT